MKTLSDFLGIYEGNAYKLVPCALYIEKSTNPRHDQICCMIYKLFLAVGEPSLDVMECSNRSYIGCTVTGTGQFGFGYSPEGIEDKEWIPWQVPQWAIAYALQLRGIIRKAEDVGYERGYDHGLNQGKSFVRRLASGEQTTVDFEKADGRDSIRLNLKKW